MKQGYETLVIGATMAGLGFAAMHADALVIEPGELPAPEWVSALVPSRPIRPTNEQGKWLAQKLTEYKALENNALDVQRFSPALCKILRDKNLPVLLLTRIVSVEKTSNGYDVEIYNNGGLSTLCVKNILDTTCRRFSTPQAQVLPSQKRFHVLSGKAPKNSDLAAYPGTVCAQEPNSLWNVAFPIDPQWEIAQARAFVIKAWERALGHNSARIAIMAAIFEECPGENPSCINKNWRWLPSRDCNDPLTAFEAGGTL